MLIPFELLRAGPGAEPSPLPLDSGLAGAGAPGTTGGTLAYPAQVLAVGDEELILLSSRDREGKPVRRLWRRAAARP